MSFSFSASGKSRGEAKSRAAMGLAQMVVEQRAHDIDQAIVKTSIDKAVDALAVPKADERVVVTAYGSAAGEWNGGELVRVTAVQFNVSVSLAKEPPAAPSPSA